MEKQPISGADQKMDEYVNRIKNGESKDSILQDLPESFKLGIEKRLIEPNSGVFDEAVKKERHEANQKKIEELREQLGITEPVGSVESSEKLPINYIEVVIDDEYMQKNLMPNGGLRMKGGHANWKGEVDLMQYVISKKLSPEYLQDATDKIEKFNAGQEKTYQHEAHHIKNRENDLTPHVVAQNLREFLAFRVLDEMSAFATGELYNQDITVENILKALQTSEQKITDSYYGQPFLDEAKWYMSQHSNEPAALSREINQEKYHKIMRQYFKINGYDVLALLQKENKISEFSKITDGLIYKLDTILSGAQLEKK